MIREGQQKIPSIGGDQYYQAVMTVFVGYSLGRLLAFVGLDTFQG